MTRDDLQTRASAEQAARTFRAATTYDKYKLININDDASAVIQSAEGFVYVIDTENGFCTCPDTQRLQRVNAALDAASLPPIRCKHAAVVQLLMHQHRYANPAEGTITAYNTKPQPAQVVTFDDYDLSNATEASHLNGAELQPFNPVPSVGAIFFDARCRNLHPVDHARAMNYGPETIAAVRLAYEANRHQNRRPVSELLSALA